MKEELPDTFQEIAQEGTERNKLRESSWRQALEGKHKSVIHCMLTKDGSNLVLSSKELFVLYDIGVNFLYKVNP